MSCVTPHRYLSAVRTRPRIQQSPKQLATVDAHGRGNSDQSSYTPDVKGGYLLFGDGGVDDGEDADVIIHEGGHALSESAAPDSRSGTERGGLDEGIGDYVVASYSYDLDTWRWFDLFNWDGQNEFWPGRTGISQRSYATTSTNNIHIRRDMGCNPDADQARARGQVMDRIAFQELYANYPNMSLADGALLMIEADSMLYQGTHTNTLLRYFCERELVAGSTCATVNTIFRSENP